MALGAREASEHALFAGMDGEPICSCSVKEGLQYTVVPGRGMDVAEYPCQLIARFGSTDKQLPLKETMGVKLNARWDVVFTELQR